MSDSDNYSDIALSSILGKLFDIVLLKQYEHVFSIGTIYTTTPVCISGYQTKAFDQVNYVKLFALLLSKGL